MRIIEEITLFVLNRPVVQATGLEPIPTTPWCCALPIKLRLHGRAIIYSVMPYFTLSYKAISLVASNEPLGICTYGSGSGTRTHKVYTNAFWVRNVYRFHHTAISLFFIKHNLHALAISPHPTNSASSVMFDCLTGLGYHPSIHPAAGLVLCTVPFDGQLSWEK